MIFTMSYFNNLPSTFKGYLDSLPEGLKLTLYIKELPKGYSVILMYQPETSDVNTTSPCSIKTTPGSAEKMLGFISEPKPTAKAEPTEIDTTQQVTSSNQQQITTGPRLRSIKTVPDLHQKSTEPDKSPAERQYHSINPKAKSRKSTTKQRSLSAYSLPRSKSSTKMKKTSDNNNWHHTYKQLMNLDNWTCRTFNTPLGCYRFMQNKLTGHKTAVHTATTDPCHAVKTVYLNEDIAMKSVIDYATRYRQADYEPMKKQYFQGVVSAIAERIYYAMN